MAEARVLIIDGREVREMEIADPAGLARLVARGRHVAVFAENRDWQRFDETLEHLPVVQDTIRLYGHCGEVAVRFREGVTVIGAPRAYWADDARLAELPLERFVDPGEAVAAACVLVIADHTAASVESAAIRAEVLARTLNKIGFVPEDVEEAVGMLRLSVADGYADLIALRLAIAKRGNRLAAIVGPRLRELTIMLRGMREVVDVVASEVQVVAARSTDVAMRIVAVIGSAAAMANLVFALYGMNFDPDYSPWSMPELRTHFGYPLAVLAAFAVGILTAAVTWSRLRPRRLTRHSREALRKLLSDVLAV